LATNTKIDAHGDGVPDVAGLVSKEALQQAILEWTKDKELGPQRAFTLYLVDHGGRNGRFYLDKPFGKWVDSDELGQWLTQLEAQAPGVRINVIIEACYSGGFLLRVTNRFNQQQVGVKQSLRTIAAPGRVVVASTEAIALAYASPTGAWFSDTLIDSLSQNLSLAEAYEEARLVAQQQNPAQRAWLDGDGDGIPNEKDDYEAAAGRGFAISGSFADEAQWPPFIKDVSLANQSDTSAEIVAQVEDDTTDEDAIRVWAVIYSPNYTPPSESEVMVTGPAPVPLIYQGNQQYRIEYPSFTENGTYRLLIYAQDMDNLQARPRELTVQIGSESQPVYLPVVLK
jgi:hypothetical protein